MARRSTITPTTAQDRSARPRVNAELLNSVTRTLLRLAKQARDARRAAMEVRSGANGSRRTGRPSSS